MNEEEVDVWNHETNEWDTGRVVDQNGGMKYVEFDDGSAEWRDDFDIERRSW